MEDMKMRFPAAIAALCLVAASCAYISNINRVHGDGNIVTVSRPVTNFQQVSVGGCGHITLLQGNEEGLTIQTDSNLLAYITTSVSNGQLWIGPNNVNLEPTKDIHYVLKFKDLRSLRCSGAINAHAERLTARNLNLDASGASSLQIDSLQADRLQADLSGASHAELGGAAASQRVSISGASRYEAGRLQTDRAQVTASGASHARLTVNGPLGADASGASSIRYAGEASVRPHTSGASSIQAVD